MDEALNILKRSVDNLRGEYIRLAKESQELDREFQTRQLTLESIAKRIIELENAIQKLEKKDDATKATSKNKKAK